MTSVKSYNPEYTEVHTDSSDFEDLQYSFKQRVTKLKKKPDLINLNKWMLIEDFHNQCNVEKRSSIEERNSEPHKDECNIMIRDDLTTKLFTSSQQKLKDIQHNFISYLSSKLQKKGKKNKNHDISYIHNTRQHEAEQNKTIDFKNLYAIEPVLTIDGNLYGFPKKISSCESLRQKRTQKFTIENYTQTRFNKDRRQRYKKQFVRHDNDRQVYMSSYDFQSKGTGFDPCNASSSWRSDEVPDFTSSETQSLCVHRVPSRSNMEKKQCKCGLGQYRCTSPVCPFGAAKPLRSNCSTQTQEFGTPNYPSPFPYPTQPTTPTKPCCCSEKIQKFMQSQPNNHCQNQQNYNEERCHEINTNEHEQSNCTCSDPMSNITPEEESPCQSPHSDVLTSLQNRYNGQVLCIHNPPCVLINGCLNITKPNDQHMKSVLKNRQQPLPRKQVCNILGIKRKPCIDRRKFDQDCQYHPPYTEVNPYDRIITNKLESLIQNKCYHRPQCEMVSKFLKQSINPTQNMYYTYTQHDPKIMSKDSKKEETILSSWQENPTYVNYLTNNLPLNTKTQVKSKRHQKSGCHHKPPCILVPKCLITIIRGKGLPKDVMPECGHQPPCQMVHTCDIDGSKEMVMSYLYF